MSTSCMQCERCGTDSAAPHDIAIVQGSAIANVPFVLCADCYAFVASIEPLQSEDEITDDAQWLAHINHIIALANDVSELQQHIDQLRMRITEKKNVLRHAVRSLDATLTDVQRQRMRDAQRMNGETAALFWIERYSRT